MEERQQTKLSSSLAGSMISVQRLEAYTVMLRSL